MHYLRNIESKIKTKIKQTWGLTDIAMMKYRSIRPLPVKPVAMNKIDYVTLRQVTSNVNKLLYWSMLRSIYATSWPRLFNVVAKHVATNFSLTHTLHSLH